MAPTETAIDLNHVWTPVVVVTNDKSRLQLLQIFLLLLPVCFMLLLFLPILLLQVVADVASNLVLRLLVMFSGFGHCSFWQWCGFTLGEVVTWWWEEVRGKRQEVSAINTVHADAVFMFAVNYWSLQWLTAAVLTLGVGVVVAADWLLPLLPAVGVVDHVVMIRLCCWWL